MPIPAYLSTLSNREEIPDLLNYLGLIGQGCEIGVQNGLYSHTLLKKWRGQRLYSIDPWKEYGTEVYVDLANKAQEEQDSIYAEAAWRLKIFDDRSIILRKTSAEAALDFLDGQLDFVYLDGNHSYESVSEDIALWYPKLKAGGLLAGHDFVENGLWPNGLFGVKQAVEEFTQQTGLSFYLTGEAGSQSWFLQKPRGEGAGIRDLTKIIPWLAQSSPAPDATKSWHKRLWKNLKPVLVPYRGLLKSILQSLEFRSIQYELKHIRKEQKLQKQYLVHLNQEQQCVGQHLRNLQFQDEFDPEKFSVSYALKLNARQLSPDIIGGNLDAPVVCTIAIGHEFSSTLTRCQATKIDYCQRHGYNHVILTSKPVGFSRHLAWLKIPLLYHLLEKGYKNIFFIDGDAMIMNPTIRLESFFEHLAKEDRHLLVSEDPWNICTGVFFIRNTWQTRTLLDLIYGANLDNSRDFNEAPREQGALITLLELIPLIRLLLLIEPDGRKFNSFPYQPKRGITLSENPYLPGDFIYHFAGLRGKELRWQVDKVSSLISQSNKS